MAASLFEPTSAPWIFLIYCWGERVLKRAELLHVLQGGGGRGAAAGDDDVPAAAAAPADLGLETAEEDDEGAAVHVGGDAAAKEDLHVGATGKQAGIS